MNNEFSISIKDFQIIKNANLTFKPGLNCIIGQSNNGKSAIFRAAKACIYNTPGTTQVRLGASNYAVGIQANGHTVIVQKGNNNVYKIDGKLYEKIGRTQLPEVAEALRVADIPINGTNEQINFQDQMEKPFLLDRSETELFRFIVDSGKDSNVTLALKSITQDRQQKSKDIDITEGALHQIEENIQLQADKLKNADEQILICNKVIELGPKIKRIEDVRVLSEHLTESYKTCEELKHTNEGKEDILKKVTPLVESLQTKIDKENVLNMLADRVETSKANLDKNKTLLNSLGTITDISDLVKDVDTYKLLCEIETRLKTAKNSLSELKEISIPSMNLDDYEKYKQVSELISNINSANSSLEIEKNKLTQVQADMTNLQKEIDDIGVCPTCGRPLSESTCII